MHPSSCFFIILGRIHIAQHTSVRVDVLPVAFGYELDAKLFHRIGDFANSALQRCNCGRGALPSINRRERFRPPCRARHNDLPVRTHRSGEQPIQPLGAKIRQVTSQNNVPFRPGGGQGRRDSGEGAGSSAAFVVAAELDVLDHLESKRRVGLERTDYRYDRNERLDEAGDSKNKWLPAKLQKTLWFAHARACAAG